MTRTQLTPALTLSSIIYGMWRLGDDADTSPAHIQVKIEACLAQGITSFDQADIYGDYGAEALLGACLKQAPHLRDQMEIITKCGIIAPVGRHAAARVKYYDTSPEHIRESVEHSLRLMGIEQIDLLLIHRPDPFMDHHATGAALDEMVKSGKVRAIGVSNFKPHDFTLLQSAMQTPLCTNQIEASVLAHAPFTNGDIAFLQERGIPPMAWSPLGGGALFGDAGSAVYKALEKTAHALDSSVPAVAIAWLIEHPAGILPVLGTNNIDRIKTLSSALDLKLDRQTWFEIYTSALGRDIA